MPITPLRLLAVFAVLALSACASVPAPRAGAIDTTLPLTTTADERHHQVAQFVDTDALSSRLRIALPSVRIADGAYGAAIDPAQALLVANHAGRSLCLGLVRYAELRASPADDAYDARLVITAIEPTSGAAAGASSVIGFFVPGPFRLPAGLGGLAVEAELRDPRAGQVALMRWARGANAVTQDAKVSSIGDAWQLAGRFGGEFSRVLLDTDATRAGVQRARLSDTEIDLNRALCAQRYGSVNLAGRGASLLLPLAPEAIDPGPPTAALPESAAAAR